jgi:hypothetical protein
MRTTEHPPGVDQLAGSYHTVHDRDDGPLNEAVYSAIADAVGIDPEYHRIPVAESIDPDGIDDVLRKASPGAYVAFTVWNLQVVVHGDGHIFVHPPDEASDDA